MAPSTVMRINGGHRKSRECDDPILSAAKGTARVLIKMTYRNPASVDSKWPGQQLKSLDVE